MVAMAEREAEAGDAVPTRKKKAVPQHVQEILQQDSMAENVLEQLPTLQDFEPVRKVRREDPGSKAPPKLIKTELYVRGIPYEMDNDGLKELFKVHKPRSSRVMKDKQGRRPLGFGFVTFYNEFKAAEAMAAMNGFAVKNERGIETQLVISYATEKKVKVKNRDLSTVSMTDATTLHANASDDARHHASDQTLLTFFGVSAEVEPAENPGHYCAEKGGDYCTRQPQGCNGLAGYAPQLPEARRPQPGHGQGATGVGKEGGAGRRTDGRR